MRHNSVSSLSFPFVALTRTPEILSIDSGNGKRPWDVDWYNKVTSYQPSDPTTVKTIRVRRAEMGYYCNIWTDSFAGSERIIDRLIALGMKGPHRADYYSHMLKNPSRITVEMAIPSRVHGPTRREATETLGNIFGVSVPLAVNGLIGTVYQKPFILDQVLTESIATQPGQTLSDTSTPFFTVYKAVQHYDGTVEVVISN